MARGVDGRETFVDDCDRIRFVRELNRLGAECRFSLLAYCLMGNHFHLAIRVEQIPLSRILHRLLTSYVMYFNARHERQGHLFQARYKSSLCLDDRYLLSLIRYIHLNPVRARIVSDPEHWPWSSHRYYLGHGRAFPIDTRLTYAALQGSSYAEWMGIGEQDFDPWQRTNTVEAPPLLRSDDDGRTALDVLALAAAERTEVVAQLRGPGRQRGIAQIKRDFAARALRDGHSLAEVARWLHSSPSAVHHLLHRNKSNK